MTAADATDLPAVSVVIPAYNAGRYLERAVESALAQTGIGRLQVVIVDDCSTDATAKVIAECAARYPDQITALSNPQNMGPAGSRNRGIAAATGDWIAVLDADDALAPGRLARLIGVAEAEGVEVIADLLVFFDLAANAVEDAQPACSGAVQRLVIEDFLRPDAESGLDLGLLKPVFRRDLAQRRVWRYPDGVRHAEDLALYVSVLRKGVDFALLREAHYLFSTRVGARSGRFSPGSVTAVNYNSVADQTEALRDEMRQAGDISPGLAQVFEDRIVRLRRQNRIYGWTVLRKGEVRRLMSWLRADTRNRQDLFAVIGQKLRGRRGLPE